MLNRRLEFVGSKPAQPAFVPGVKIPMMNTSRKFAVRWTIWLVGLLVAANVPHTALVNENDGKELF